MRNKYKHGHLLPRLHILGIDLCGIRWKSPIERTFEKSSKVQGADNPWVSKPNPISLPKVIDKTYLHLMLELCLPLQMRDPKLRLKYGQIPDIRN